MPDQMQQQLQQIKHSKLPVAAVSPKHYSKQDEKSSPQNIAKPKADIKFEESSDSFGTDESFEEDDDEEEEVLEDDIPSPKDVDKDKTNKGNRMTYPLMPPSANM